MRPKTKTKYKAKMMWDEWNLGNLDKALPNLVQLSKKIIQFKELDNSYEAGRFVRFFRSWIQNVFSRDLVTLTKWLNNSSNERMIKILEMMQEPLKNFIKILSDGDEEALNQQAPLIMAHFLQQRVEQIKSFNFFERTNYKPVSHGLLILDAPHTDRLDGIINILAFVNNNACFFQYCFIDVLTRAPVWKNCVTLNSPLHKRLIRLETNARLGYSMISQRISSAEAERLLKMAIDMANEVVVFHELEESETAMSTADDNDPVFFASPPELKLRQFHSFPVYGFFTPITVSIGDKVDPTVKPLELKAESVSSDQKDAAGSDEEMEGIEEDEKSQVIKPKAVKKPAEVDRDRKAMIQAIRIRDFSTIAELLSADQEDRHFLACHAVLTEVNQCGNSLVKQMFQEAFTEYADQQTKRLLDATEAGDVEMVARLLDKTAREHVDWDQAFNSKAPIQPLRDTVINMLTADDCVPESKALRDVYAKMFPVLNGALKINKTSDSQYAYAQHRCFSTFGAAEGKPRVVVGKSFKTDSSLKFS